MFLKGISTQGMYTDDYEEVSAEILSELYGVHGRPVERPEGATGAGQLPDEDIEAVNSDIEVEIEEDEVEALGDRIQAANESKFNAEPVGVPKHADPFPSREILDIFDKSIIEAATAGIVPPGYGLLQDEWEKDIYPAYEIIGTGRRGGKARGGKELRIELPTHIWFPRAVLWGQGLDLMNRLQDMMDTTT